MPEFNPELTKTATKEFDSHIQISDNNRIIFSGRYGLGKTTFLTSYFREKSNKYYMIRLAPVNYSVASNDDIFKYIKYDILKSLISDNMLSLETFDYSKWEVLPFYLENSRKDIVKSAIRAISKLGPMKAVGIDAIYRELEGLYNKLGELQVKSNTGKKKEVDGFFQVLDEEDGSLYEFNLITELISKGLGGVSNKENVLVIDDLDRIDPEHIFRLFNVFAAHVDFKGEEGDKFGFDKVIFVCDVENIQSIFHHRYGLQTDFSGYIDKFYSSKVFYFDNKNDLKRILKHYVNAIEFPNSRHITNDGSLKNILDELFYIIDRLRVNDSYNLRNLMLTNSKHTIESKSIFLKNGLEVYSNQMISAIVLQILLSLFGDKGTLRKHLEVCYRKEETDSQLFEGRLNNILLLAFIEKHELKEKRFHIVEYDPLLQLNIDSFFDSGIKNLKIVNLDDLRKRSRQTTDSFKIEMNLFKLYLRALDTLTENGAL